VNIISKMLIVPYKILIIRKLLTYCIIWTQEGEKEWVAQRGSSVKESCWNIDHWMLSSHGLSLKKLIFDPAPLLMTCVDRISHGFVINIWMATSRL
jgi:hypothetical protein